VNELPDRQRRDDEEQAQESDDERWRHPMAGPRDAQQPSSAVRPAAGGLDDTRTRHGGTSLLRRRVRCPGPSHPATRLCVSLPDRPVAIVCPIFSRTCTRGDFFIGDRDVLAGPGSRAQQDRDGSDPEHGSPQCETHLGSSHGPESLRHGTAAWVASDTHCTELFAADARTLRLLPPNETIRRPEPRADCNPT
jgi:hypothetical protein